jgi:hypothetical protein
MGGEYRRKASRFLDSLPTDSQQPVELKITVKSYDGIESALACFGDTNASHVELLNGIGELYGALVNAPAALEFNCFDCTPLFSRIREKVDQSRSLFKLLEAVKINSGLDSVTALFGYEIPAVAAPMEEILYELIRELQHPDALLDASDELQAIGSTMNATTVFIGVSEGYSRMLASCKPFVSDPIYMLRELNLHKYNLILGQSSNLI